MTETWTAIATERTELADMLESFTEDQWNAPSLCTEWRVRDVVAHVVAGSQKQPLFEFLVPLTKNMFNVNKTMARLAIEKGNEPPENLLKELRECVGARDMPPFTKPIDMLADTMIHDQDIRRPLGIARAIPRERLVPVLDRMANLSAIMGNKRRIRGLRLVATDIDWTHGEGPEVRGSGEAILMATCGRKTALDDLEGEGVATLRTRR